VPSLEAERISILLAVLGQRQPHPGPLGGSKKGSNCAILAFAMADRGAMRACAITCSHGQPVEWRMRARLRWTMAARGEKASSVDRCARHACGEGNFRSSKPCEVVSRWCQTELGVRTGACSEPHDNSQVSPSRTEGSRHGKATLAAAATSGVFAGRKCRRDGDRDAQQRRGGRKKVVRDWEEGEGG